MLEKIIFFLCFCLFFFNCENKYSSKEISKSYCQCAELSGVNKSTCIDNWLTKFKGSLNSREEFQEVNYNMIECNGFEGENDFKSKLREF